MNATTVKVQSIVEVEVTPENERILLRAEFERRYEDRKFIEGDDVIFTREGRSRHVEALGEDHIGKPAIVTAQSENGQDVKVLAISNDGDFVELWTPEACLETIEGVA